MIRRISSRFDVIRDGAKLTELRALNTPRIDASANAAIKMSMAAKFEKNDAVDWMRDEITPVLILNGQDYPMGVFRAGAFTESREGSMDTVTVEGYDRCYRMREAKTETILHLPAEMNYVEAVKSLLVRCGLVMVIETKTTAVLATDREDWEIGTPFLTIANQLLSEINYKDLWFDPAGYARLEPKVEPTAARIDHSYRTEDVKAMVQEDCSITTDAFDKPNVFIAVMSNPDYDEPIVCRAENTSPQSPFSIPRRGMRVVSVERVDNAASEEELQRYVNQKCFESMMESSEIRIKTALEPGHGVEDIVALVHPSISGICVETAWSMELAAGCLMTHTLKKVVYPT